MNGHLENIDENFFDEFHNVNTHIYKQLERLMGKNSTEAYNDNALR